MQYYIGVGNDRRGPFERDQLLAQGVQPETLIWRQGLSNWVRAVEVAEIKELLGSIPPPIPNRSQSTTASAGPAVASRPLASMSLLTNSALPPMANAICIFTIVLLPVYWIFSAAASLVTFASTPTDADIASFLLNLFVFGPISLAIVVVLALGGLRLRDLRSSGPRLIKMGLWCDLAFIIVQIVLVVPLLAWLSSGDESSASASTAALLVLVLETFLGLCAFVFEIVTLVWLNQHGDELPTSA